MPVHHMNDPRYRYPSPGTPPISVLDINDDESTDTRRGRYCTFPIDGFNETFLFENEAGANE